MQDRYSLDRCTCVDAIAITGLGENDLLARLPIDSVIEVAGDVAEIVYGPKTAC